MKEFSISVHSVQEVKAFVALAMTQPFEVLVCNDHQQVNGKNYMGMFALDLRQPLQVQVECDEDSFCRFRQKTTELFAS